MSDIMLIKNSIEIKTIEVPDYTSKFNMIDKLEGLKEESTEETHKTMEVLGSSIIEQISAYIYELVKPVIKYYGDKHTNIPNDFTLNYYGWQLTTRQVQTHECVDMIIFKHKICDVDLWVVFDKNGYTIHDENLRTTSLKTLVDLWPELKKELSNTIEKTINYINASKQAVIMENNKIIKALENFEL